MYNTNKSLSIRFFIVSFTLLVFTVFTSPISADENYGNITVDAKMRVNPEKFPAIVPMAMGVPVIIKIT